MWSNNNWRNEYVNYDSFSIAFQIAFTALNQLNKLVHDVFEYVQCFDLEIWTCLSFYLPINKCVHFAFESRFRYSSVKPPISKCRESAVKGENAKWLNSKLDLPRKDTSRNVWVFWHVTSMHGYTSRVVTFQSLKRLCRAVFVAKTSCRCGSLSKAMHVSRRDIKPTVLCTCRTFKRVIFLRGISGLPS